MANKNETIDAIHDSVARWGMNCLAEFSSQIDIETSRCALCTLFREDRCVDCPVALHTGQDGCRGTNHRRVYDAALAVENGNGSMAEFRAEACIYTATLREIYRKWTD